MCNWVNIGFFIIKYISVFNMVNEWFCVVLFDNVYDYKKDFFFCFVLSMGKW